MVEVDRCRSGDEVRIKDKEGHTSGLGGCPIVYQWHRMTAMLALMLGPRPRGLLL